MPYCISFDENLWKMKTRTACFPALTRIKSKPAKEGCLAYSQACYSLHRKLPISLIVKPHTAVPQPSPADFCLTTLDLLFPHLDVTVVKQPMLVMDSAFSS